MFVDYSNLTSFAKKSFWDCLYVSFVTIKVNYIHIYGDISQNYTIFDNNSEVQFLPLHIYMKSGENCQILL